MDVELSQDGSPSPSDNQVENQTSSGSTTRAGDNTTEQVAAAISELDKMKEFSFRGQKYTPQDLEKAILRQKDYTQKTQALSKDRESFESDRKFYENLWADLEFVRSNQSQAVVEQFLKTYPEKFHAALKNVLNGTQSPQQATQNSQNQQPKHDVDLLARITKLESTFTEQEVAKNTEHINLTVDKLAKKYPDAIPELVIGRVFEAYNQGMKPTDQTWEDTFKAVDAEMKQVVKAKYGELVKKQTQANARARDVDAGGGTVGRAPKKFKNLQEVTNFAVSELTGKGQ